MTSKTSLFIVSRPFVVGVNVVVLALCALSILGLIPTSSDESVGARFIPALAPALTIGFLLARAQSKVLAAVVLTVNILVLLPGFYLLFHVMGNSAVPLWALLVLLFLVVFVPLVSVLSVASHWPSRGSRGNG